MATPQFLTRALRPRLLTSSTIPPVRRVLFNTSSSSGLRANNKNNPDLNERSQSTAPAHREYQTSKPLNPSITNTTSTSAKGIPKVGAQNAPPEFISSADPNYKPAGAEHVTGGGGAQAGEPRKPDLDLGELEGIKFKVEPLKREGEDTSTMRARMLYQSRKRGTLESDLLLSTFADAYLPSMTRAQLQEYDRLLDENDWDIYYWVTQEPEAASVEGETLGAEPAKDTPTDVWKNGAAKSGEWAQTVGAFKPAYRPVPQRWKDSELLAELKEHVRSRKAQKEGSKPTKGGGLGRMPDVHIFDG
ncbi:hypothetical protein AJ80_03492 [Polytolypa hystricis UAMH7299]|uniref:Succinate dehydrogenase assembly factor 2, mitochondrial n=1 Tax=Polytolypa hystricis (strain UAMH7299) TaxID=1447883 RepID=A0A2B7YIP9_POLH7|nr:hypothetical protein AJ80_03492 [Polytolypa hystricis UAMH7299]